MLALCLLNILGPEAICGGYLRTKSKQVQGLVLVKDTKKDRKIRKMENFGNKQKNGLKNRQRKESKGDEMKEKWKAGSKSERKKVENEEGRERKGGKKYQNEATQQQEKCVLE